VTAGSADRCGILAGVDLDWMSGADVAGLLEQLRGLESVLQEGGVASSTATLLRLQGACAVLEVVLGRQEQPDS
jgi:hypothetical protein